MKKVPLLLLLSFAVIGYFLFGSVLNHYFISDDFVWLLHAKHDSMQNVLRYPFDSQGFFYRPFTKLYFYAMWQWFSTNPVPYHVVNVILHGINSLLVYFLSLAILLRFFPAKRVGRMALFAAVSSVLFFIHPAHQENIIWISAVTELFPALFVLLALNLFIRARDHGAAYVGSWVVFFVSFILGLMSHEYVVIFPALVFITEYFCFGKFKNKSFYVWLLLVDVIYLFLRASANSHWSGGDYSYNLVKLPFNVVGNVSGYIGLSIFGVPFISFYQSMRNVLRDNIGLSALLLVLGLVAVGYIVRMAKRNYVEESMDTVPEKLFLYLALFFGIALLPFLGLGGLAERYDYLPSFAFLLFMSLFLYWIIHYFDVPTRTYSTWYWSMVVLISVLYLFSAKQDQADWKTASDFVYNRLSEFRDQCDRFTPNETVARVSPPNRTGRAWVFQVGYEQGANVLCDKNIKILLK